jgi:hypothetical protein
MKSSRELLRFTTVVLYVAKLLVKDEVLSVELSLGFIQPVTKTSMKVRITAGKRYLFDEDCFVFRMRTNEKSTECLFTD